MFLTAVIFARGGSKGLKNKNLLKIGNVSLLGHSITQAKKMGIFNRIFVSTDNKKIALEATKYGAEVPFLRPKSLAKDNSPEIYSWRHFINFIKKNLKLSPDYVVSLPATSPLRSINDVKKCVNKAKRESLDMVFAITPSSKNPFFNMVKIKKKKIELICNNKNIYFNRQKAPICFDLTTVCYVFKPIFVMNNLNLLSGKTGFVKISKESSIDIDDFIDYKISKLLMKNKSNL
jgi:CMP-N-acetylneuraminic acid synthetase